MNEELQQALIEVITAFANSVGGAADFAIAQAPEVVQQLLLWKFVSMGALFAVGVVLLIVAAVALARRRKWVPRIINPASNEVDAWLEEMAGSSELDLSYYARKLAQETKRKLPRKEGCPPDELYGFAAICATMAAPLIILGSTWIQIWLAPKVYLLEYAANLVVK